MGDLVAPAFFGALIATCSRGNVLVGYMAGSALVLGASLVDWRWAVASENKPLE